MRSVPPATGTSFGRLTRPGQDTSVGTGHQIFRPTRYVPFAEIC
jgi:hypothetical protein